MSFILSPQQAGHDLLEFLASDECRFREHQFDIGENICADLSLGNRHGALVAATGIGKTVIMGTAARALHHASVQPLSQAEHPRPRRTLVLTPRIDLVKPTAKKFMDPVGFQPDQVGIYRASLNAEEKHDVFATDKAVTIMPVQSVQSAIENGYLDPDAYDYVILDEAHMMQGELTHEMLKTHFINSGKHIVHAFTATGHFDNGLNISETLFGRSDLIDHIPLYDAIRQGFVCEMQNLIFQHRIEIDPAILAEEADARGLSENQLVRAKSRRARDEKTYDIIENYVHHRADLPDRPLKDQKMMVFGKDIDHCKAIADELNERFGSHYARAIDGTMPTRQREAILAAHRAGEFKALVSADLLIQGHDDDEIGAVVMMRDVQSEWMLMQMVGRVMRLNMQDPDKVGIYLSVVDEAHPSLTPPEAMLRDMEGRRGLEALDVMHVRRKRDPLLELAEQEQQRHRPKLDIAEIDADGTRLIQTQQQFNQYVREKDNRWSQVDLSQYLTLSDIERQTGLRRNTQAFSAVVQEMREQGTIGGKPVDVLFGQRPTDPVRLHRDDLATFEAQCHILSPKGAAESYTQAKQRLGQTFATQHADALRPDVDIPFYKIAESVGLTPRDDTYRTVLGHLMRQAAASQAVGTSQPIRAGQRRYLKADGSVGKVFCVHVDDVADVREMLCNRTPRMDSNLAATSAASQKNCPQQVQ